VIRSIPIVSSPSNPGARAPTPPAPRPLQRHRRPPRGNALVFSMLALVIGGIVLALGVGYYQNSQANAQVQSTISEIGAIIGSAQQNYGQYGYTGLTTAIAVGSRVIPETRADSTGRSARNSYSGQITLQDNSGNTPDTAALTYTGVPSSQCTQIINGAQSMTRQIAVGTTEVKPLDSPIDVAKVNAQCVAAASVTINFVFGRT
jgi:type II secretory pathway pseudopilin PulG